MRSLKKFIKKVYHEETTKSKVFCEKEQGFYTIKTVEAKHCDFMSIYENLDDENLLKYVIVYDEYYFALVYAEDWLLCDTLVLEVTSTFESLDFHELSYEKFLIQLQKEQEEIELVSLEDD